MALAIRNILGYYPGNIFLYQLAFRHKSASKEFVNGLKMSNERLEYLGDAVLSSIVGITFNVPCALRHPLIPQR